MAKLPDHDSGKSLLFSKSNFPSDERRPVEGETVHDRNICIERWALHQLGERFGFAFFVSSVERKSEDYLVAWATCLHETINVSLRLVKCGLWEVVVVGHQVNSIY